jgi:hypothetical protein
LSTIYRLLYTVALDTDILPEMLLDGSARVLRGATGTFHYRFVVVIGARTSVLASASRPPLGDHVLTISVLGRLACTKRQLHLSAPRLNSAAANVNSAANAKAAANGPKNSSASSADTPAPPLGIPYSELTVGVPRETFPHEARVAVSPTGVAALRKAGFKRVVVESDAGAAANFPDEAYTAAGADIVQPGTAAESADIVLAVRPPSLESAGSLKKDQTLISFLHPGINKELVAKIQGTGAMSFAMDAIPRISRAQVFDALSSMANTAGYRAVLEAGNSFGRFFTGQVTAAGKIPPAKVLVSASCMSRASRDDSLLASG